MMEFYHGTIDALVPSILKEGLRPMEEYMWDSTKAFGFSGYNPKNDDKKGYVHLTPNPMYAAKYAEGKVNYFNCEPGGTFDAMGMVFIKGQNAPVIKAKPALLRVRFTEAESKRIYLDYQDSRGIQFAGKVPKGRIAVLPISGVENIPVSPLILDKLSTAGMMAMFTRKELVKVFA